MDNFSTLVDLLIKDEANGTSTAHEKILILGDTPTYLVDKANFQNHLLAIKYKTISKACFDHGISTNVLKRLPYIISEPKFLFKSANIDQDDSVVLLTVEIHNSSPVVIPIRKDQRIGRSETYNVVTSVYGKDGPDPIQKWIKQDLLIWKNSNN